MPKLTIRVTEDHIRRGRRAAPGNCPVALAASEALRATGMIVNDLVVPGYLIRVVEQPCGEYRPRILHAELSSSVQERIDFYDYHGVMSPFSFDAEFTA